MFLDWSWITQPEGWAVLVLLVFLEIVLGIDNIIFISIITRGLPPPQERRLRNIGLGLAGLIRLGMLAGVASLVHLQTPLFSFHGIEVSWKDAILIAGGLFLLAKSTHEIHKRVEGEEANVTTPAQAAAWQIVLQILLVDTIFSIDSILTAVGLTTYFTIIAIAIAAAVAVMMLFAEVVSRFLRKYPTFQMLALAFLILIGVLLIVEGFHYHVPRGYVYFALLFSLFVEALNIRVRKHRRQKNCP